MFYKQIIKGLPQLNLPYFQLLVWYLGMATLSSEELIKIKEKTIMPPLNTFHPSPVTFSLMGIPGLEHLHVWIGIPFCSMYVVVVVGNVTILAVVRAE